MKAGRKNNRKKAFVYVILEFEEKLSRGYSRWKGLENRISMAIIRFDENAPCVLKILSIHFQRVCRHENFFKCLKSKLSLQALRKVYITSGKLSLKLSLQ